ncbi:MAG TPA: ankyrin repeat domain-containing protein [Steroidobacteraceae bacterium]|nr:ankyrin repeat domain-containing protein [Steroidobacteraceae bacterium]
MTRWLIAAAGMLAIAGTAIGAPVPGDSHLADLAQAGNDAAALKLIQAGGNVNAPQADGATALDWAAYHLNTDLVKALLKHGADPNAMNSFGSAPLIEAVKADNLEITRMLLAAGAKADAPNGDGQTALMLAARIGSVPIVKALLQHGASVNAREQWHGQTALMWAAAQDHPDVVRLLVDHKALVNVRAKFNDWLDNATQITSEPRAQYRPEGGLTPLLYAIRGQCQECVVTLLKAGADVNMPAPEGATPLMTAIDNLQYGTAKYLLQHGANPETWDWYGRTPLWVAVDMNSYIQRFASGASYGLQTQPGSHHADQKDSTTALDIARMLLAMGADPNVQLNLHRPSHGAYNGRFTDDLVRTGCTPLLRAAMSHDNEMVTLLLQHGALVDLPNVNGVTPLIAAAGMGMRGGPNAIVPDFRGDFSEDAGTRAVTTLELLLKAGADVNARVTDTSSHSGRIARASQMTERQGQTALYGAITRHWTPVVQYLLAHGAKVGIADDKGRTPLVAATKGVGDRNFSSDKDIVALISQAAAAQKVSSTVEPATARAN